MALRLSGQLLLGVVKIYSRKARYLLEDCNDALIKIKMAFRPGNVDLSMASVRSAQAQASNLLLPDTLTEFDLLMPDPNFNLNLDFDMDAPPLSTANLSRAQDITLDRSLEFGRGNEMYLEEEEEADPLAGGVDLNLDTGEEGPSIEFGRRAGSEMRDDIGMSFQALDNPADKDVLPDLEQDIEADISALPDFQPLDFPVPADDLGELPQTPRAGDMNIEEPEILLDEQETPRPARQAARKRRIVEDHVTEIPKRTMEAGLRDTSAIRKKQRFLDSDPIMLSLMSKSLTGGFAKDIFAPAHLNPAIRNLLAPEFLHRMAMLRLKRKRTDAAPGADQRAKEARAEVLATNDMDILPLSEIDIPEISLPQIPEEDFDPPPLIMEDDNLRNDEAMDEHVTQDAYLDPPRSDVVEPEQTQVEPQSQVTSIDTRQAIGQIRAGLEGEQDVTFAQLSSSTTKAAASELFFQVLLLATKDAITVQQTTAYGDILINSRPSLFTMSIESQTQATQ